MDHDNQNLKNSITIWKNEYDLLKNVSNNSFEQFKLKVINYILLKDKYKIK
jgi:hypothetical protein